MDFNDNLFFGNLIYLSVIIYLVMGTFNKR